MAWWKSCSTEEEMASTAADMACSRARLGVSWTDVVHRLLDRRGSSPLSDNPLAAHPHAGVVGGNEDGDDAVEEETRRLKQSLAGVARSTSGQSDPGLLPRTWAALWDLGRAMPPRLRFELRGGQDFVGAALSLELLHGGG
jgi:hypothetical protein